MDISHSITRRFLVRVQYPLSVFFGIISSLLASDDDHNDNNNNNGFFFLSWISKLKATRVYIRVNFLCFFRKCQCLNYNILKPWIFMHVKEFVVASSQPSCVYNACDRRWKRETSQPFLHPCDRCNINFELIRWLGK